MTPADLLSIPRKCSKCGRLLTAEKFLPRGRQCRECQSAYYRQWRVNNADKITINQRRYRERNREAMRARQARWQTKNGNTPSGILKDLRYTSSRFPNKPTTIDETHLIDVGASVGLPCSLTGIPLGPRRLGGRRWNTLSIDRIDASQGYEPGNIRPVLWAVNCLLNGWGEDLAYLVARAFADHYEIQHPNRVAWLSDQA